LYWERTFFWSSITVEPAVILLLELEEIDTFGTMASLVVAAFNFKNGCTLCLLTSGVASVPAISSSLLY
jgi:hypothetical protein